MTGFAYQWYRDGKPIDGATDITYTWTIADLGHDVSVMATPILDGDDRVLPDIDDLQDENFTGGRRTEEFLELLRRGEL